MSQARAGCGVWRCRAPARRRAADAPDPGPPRRWPPSLAPPGAESRSKSSGAAGARVVTAWSKKSPTADTGSPRIHSRREERHQASKNEFAKA